MEKNDMMAVTETEKEEKEETFESYRKRTARIAQELYYNPSIIRRIKNATTPREIELAMIAGRHSIA